jgi:hypothetical protein
MPIFIKVQLIYTKSLSNYKVCQKDIVVNPLKTLVSIKSQN